MMGTCPKVRGRDGAKKILKFGGTAQSGRDVQGGSSHLQTKTRNILLCHHPPNTFDTLQLALFLGSLTDRRVLARSPTDNSFIHSIPSIHHARPFDRWATTKTSHSRQFYRFLSFNR